MFLYKFLYIAAFHIHFLAAGPMLQEKALKLPGVVGPVEKLPLLVDLKDDAVLSLRLVALEAAVVCGKVAVVEGLPCK